MARIVVSIVDNHNKLFHWESSEMETFTAAILIRSLASALDSTVDDSVMDNIITKLQMDENHSLRKAAKRAGVSHATMYRKLPPLRKRPTEEP